MQDISLNMQPGGQGQAKPLCLRNPDYVKMRKKVETTFPDQLETAKVPYRSNATMVGGGALMILHVIVYCRDPVV